MKHALRPLLAAAAVAAGLTLVTRAGDETTCPASKAKLSSQTECAAMKTKSVLLKIKNPDDALGKTLGRLEGVTGTETCSDSKLTKVSYRGDKLGSTQILAALKGSGYLVQSQRIAYAVSGLACGACCDHVSKALSKVTGVTESNVCPESKQAVVEFDPNTVSAEKVLAAIDATGYKATEIAD